MNWYKKYKDKKETRNDEIGHKIFGDIWNNKKERSALLLLFWFIFISIIIAFIRFGNQTTKKDITPEPLSYPAVSTLLTNIDNNNYKYNISIYDTNSGTFTYYNGEVNNGIESGTKETTSEVINYNIKDGIIYDTNNNTVINNLYDNYLTKYFNLNNINDFITNLVPEISYEDNIIVYKYNGKYNDIDIDFIIKTNQEKITYIEYNYNGYKYLVNITNTINND